MKLHWFVTDISKSGQRDHNSKIQKYLDRHKKNHVGQIDNFIEDHKFFTVVVIGEVKPLNEQLVLRRLDEFLQEKHQ